MYFIFYSNNTFEIVKEINKTFERLVENGVINFIFDIEKNILKAKTEKGVIDIPVPVIE